MTRPKPNAVEITYRGPEKPEDARQDARERGVPEDVPGRVVDTRLSGHTIIRWEWDV